MSLVYLARARLAIETAKQQLDALERIVLAREAEAVRLAKQAKGES
jgi:hypothetical protein